MFGGSPIQTEVTMMYATVAIFFTGLSMLAHWRLGRASHPRPWDAEVGLNMGPGLPAERR